MLRTAIAVKYLHFTSNRPSRLKASTLSDRPVSVTVSHQAFDCDDDRYAAALAALLGKLGDGWGAPSQWVGGYTNEGRIYVRVDASRRSSPVHAGAVEMLSHMDDVGDEGAVKRYLRESIGA